MTAQDGHTHTHAYDEHNTYTSWGLGDAAGSAARVHEKHTSREGSSGMGPSGRFGPFPCDDSNGRRGGVPWD